MNNYIPPTKDELVALMVFYQTTPDDVASCLQKTKRSVFRLLSQYEWERSQMVYGDLFLFVFCQQKRSISAANWRKELKSDGVKFLDKTKSKELYAEIKPYSERRIKALHEKIYKKVLDNG